MTRASVTERPRRLLVRAAAVFDGVSVPVAGHAVLIDGATVVAVGPVEDVADADVLDLGGATLLPGLVDTHVHLAFDASPDPVGALAARDDAAVVSAMTEAARTMAAGGVTTCRDLGDRAYLSLGLRGMPGLPTILAAGPPLTTPKGHCHYLGGEVPPGVDAVRAAVREHVERGVDVIKVMASGGTLTPGTRQEDGQFEPDELRAAVDEAHRLGRPITAHVHARAAMPAVIAAGFDGLEHVTFWTEDGVDAADELIRQLVESRVVIGATAGLRPVPGAAPPPAVLARLREIIANHGRMLAAGSVTVVGTDAGIGPTKPHDVLRYAPSQLAEVGVSALDSLRRLTSGAAGALGLGSTKGRLAPGYDADILAVDGDPMADAAAIHRIRAVFLRGVRVR